MNRSPFGLVVFDVAGTTVLDGDIVQQAMQDALESFGASASRAHVDAVMGIPKPLAIRSLLYPHRDAAARADDADALVARVHENFVARLLERYAVDPAVRPAPGAVEVFARLRAGGVKVALDTGFDRRTLEVLLARLEWSVPATLDATVASDEVASGRPSDGLIRRAMQLTGVSHSAAVVKVGDTPSDIQSGRAAACGLVVGVSYGSHSREALLAHHPSAVVDSLDALLTMVLA